MANTYYDSQLTAAEIEAALEAIAGVIVPANNGKVLAINNGKLEARSVQWGGGEPVIEALSVTENGTYNPPSGVDGYAPVTVNVSGGSGGDVPSGYSRLAYIESDGSQYIDTGVGDSSGFLCIANAGYASVGGSWATLCGAQTGEPGGGSSRQGLIIRYSNGSNYCAWYGSSFADTGIPLIINSLAIHITDTRTNWILSVSNGGNYSATGGNRTSNNLFLFAMNVAGEANYFANGRIDYLKLYNHSGQLVRDFYAAKRNSDNALGLWDKVSQTFFTNDGTGTFIEPT